MQHGVQVCEHHAELVAIHGAAAVRVRQRPQRMQRGEYLGVKAQRTVVPMPTNGDVPFTHANITAARADFGYSPKTDLETGLSRFARWYHEWVVSGKIDLSGRAAFEAGQRSVRLQISSW